MNTLLTRQELINIENTIDEINFRADKLDHANYVDAQILDADNDTLSKLIPLLEQSHRRTRIIESGFKLIQ